MVKLQLSFFSDQFELLTEQSREMQRQFAKTYLALWQEAARRIQRLLNALTIPPRCYCALEFWGKTGFTLLRVCRCSSVG